MNNNLLDKIWDELDNCKIKDLKNNKIQKIERYCSNCKTLSENICTNCGLIVSNDDIYDTNSYVDYYQLHSEKNQSCYYNLSNYLNNILKRLNLPSERFPKINDIIYNKIQVIHKHCGVKRGQVRDGIILVLIEHESANTGNFLSSFELAKIINLAPKYISKAKDLFVELESRNVLSLECAKYKNEFDYINEYFELTPEILERAKQISNSKHLDGSRTLTKAVVTLYIIMTELDLKFDKKQLCKKFNITTTTLNKFVKFFS